MWGPSRWCGDDKDDMGMTWGQQGRHGNHGDNMGWRPRRPWRPQPWEPSGSYGDDVGMMGMTQGWHGADTGTTWGPWGQHRVETTKTMETTAMGTTWEPSGGYGMMWGWWGWHGDDVGMTGTTWWQQGQHGDHGDNMGWRPRRQRRPQPLGPHGDLLGAMGMMWGQWGWHGDDMGTMGTMWGQCGDHGDNEITFEQIEIIEFSLKIWDPWTLPHTCRLQLMYRWGVSYPKCHFYPESAPVTLEKKNFPVFALDPIRPYLDWALRGFLTSWPIYDPLKLQPKWKQSAKFDWNVNFHTQPLTIEKFWMHP